MKRILVIDIGNTNITIGLFKGSRLVKKAKISTYSHSARDLHRMVPKDIECIVVSSVVPKILLKLKKALKRITNAKINVAGEDIKVPIRNLYKKPAQVGQDRLVDAFAARKIYGAPCVVIDFGTAITFDVVSKKGEYLGGLILPGIELSLSSLYNKTALLPKVELRSAHNIIGKDTIDSIRGGILFGFGAMCNDLTARYRKILGRKMKVIATGGNAALIKRYASSIQIVDENLTLKGLSLLSVKKAI